MEYAAHFYVLGGNMIWGAEEKKLAANICKADIWTFVVISTGNRLEILVGLENALTKGCFMADWYQQRRSYGTIFTKYSLYKTQTGP